MNKRKTILAKAKQLFAEKGFDGTTVDEISELSKTNKAMIYYYFGSKEKLYEEAFKSSLEIMYRRLLKELSSTEDPRESLKKYIETFYNHAQEDGTLLRILTREIASNGKHFPPNIANTFIKIVKILDDILQKGSTSGIFNVRETKIVHFIILGTISYLLISAPLRAQLKDKLQHIPSFLNDDKETIDKLSKLILEGLKNHEY